MEDLPLDSDQQWQNYHPEYIAQVPDRAINQFKSELNAYPDYLSKQYNRIKFEQELLVNRIEAVAKLGELPNRGPERLLDMFTVLYRTIEISQGHKPPSSYFTDFYKPMSDDRSDLFDWLEHQFPAPAIPAIQRETAVQFGQEIREDPKCLKLIFERIASTQPSLIRLFDERKTTCARDDKECVFFDAILGTTYRFIEIGIQDKGLQELTKDPDNYS